MRDEHATASDPILPDEPASATTTRRLPLDDPEALGRLLLAIEPRLQAVATRITRNPDAARDVVQSAFEKALRHGARFEGQSRVSTWLHRIVTNEALMWLRSQRRRGEVQDDGAAHALERLPSATPCPAEYAERRQSASLLHDGLARLCAEERDVLLRCGLGDESYACYSKRSGLHVGAVKTRAFRGRRHLHALLLSS